MARDYAKEYAASRTPKRRLANIMRKRARRLEIKKHGAAALKGKEVDHVHMLDGGNHLAGANRTSNLAIISRHANRIKQPKRK